jgi:hypothetical protein
METIFLFLPLALLILIAWAVMRGLKRVADKSPPATAGQGEVAGVGGWLLFLILGLVFLGPLMGAAHINSDIMSVESQYPRLKTDEAWGTFKSATWLTFLVVCCLSFYAGFGLLKRRDLSVVNRAKILLWVIGPLASLVMGTVLPIFVFGKVESYPQSLGQLVASGIVAAIWTVYLSRSKRVKATYSETQGTSA